MDLSVRLEPFFSLDDKARATRQASTCNGTVVTIDEGRSLYLDPYLHELPGALYSLSLLDCWSLILLFDRLFRLAGVPRSVFSGFAD
jgi:hypothetical protein